MSEKLTLGIDIGGTKTAYGVVNSKGEIIFGGRMATKDFNDPGKLFLFIAEALKKEELFDSVTKVGIGAPNGNSKTGRVEFAPNLSWKGIVEIETVSKQVFDKPSFLVNDANAAALGELEYGIAQDLTDFVTITLGTGLGSGIIINKQLIDGAHGFAGEYGHITVYPAGRLCGCGRRGCLETYASSTGVCNTFRFMKENSHSDFEDLDINASAKDIFESALKGNSGAMEVMNYTADVLGQALANFVCFSDPQAFVLFGGISQIGEPFRLKVQKAYDKYALKIYSSVDIKISSLPSGNAAILGAAGAAKSK